MKTICIFFNALLMCSTWTYAQDSTHQIGLNKELFKKILNQQFSSLVTGQSKTSIGNFAALDLTTSEVSFAGSSIFKNGSVLGIKASGGVSDGLFEVFSNSSLNPKVSLDLQYNHLALRHKSLTYFDDSFQTYQGKIKKIRDNSSAKLLEISYGQEKNLLIIKKENLINTKNKLQTLKLDAIKKINKPYKAEDSVENAILDTLSFHIAQLDCQIDTLTKLLNNYPKKEFLKEDEDNRRAKELKTINADVEIYSFAFGWLSIGYKVQDNSFKFFDPLSQYDSQVQVKSFVGHEARIQYSFYNWTIEPFKSYYWSVGAGFTYSDNFNSLSKIEISEVKNYGPNTNDRSVTKKYNAYTGTYNQGNKGLRLYGDYYHFLFNGNSGAIHTFPEVQITDSNSPVYNLGFGFLYSFKDSKDETATVNAELYYNFLDLTKSTETTYRLFERNSIGLRFSFPINFKSN